MATDTDRLVAIAHELKTLDQRREGLLAELARIAAGFGGTAAVARRGPGRPPGSRNQSKPAAAAPGPKQRKGLTTDIVEFMKSGGGAYTAGEILDGLKLTKSRSRLSTISTTLVRLAKEGRAKKDKQRGYRAA